MTKEVSSLRVEGAVVTAGVLRYRNKISKCLKISKISNYLVIDEHEEYDASSAENATRRNFIRRRFRTRESWKNTRTAIARPTIFSLETTSVFISGSKCPKFIIVL
jgi:hypothetical protein